VVAAYTFLALCIAVVAVAVVVVTVKRPGAPASPAAASRPAGTDDSSAVAVVRSGPAVLSLRPHAELARLPGLGHYPQIEDPAAALSLRSRYALRSVRDRRNPNAAVL